jgi:hypothetical protein
MGSKAGGDHAPTAEATSAKAMPPPMWLGRGALRDACRLRPHGRSWSQGPGHRPSATSAGADLGLRKPRERGAPEGKPAPMPARRTWPPASDPSGSSPSSAHVNALVAAAVALRGPAGGRQLDRVEPEPGRAARFAERAPARASTTAGRVPDRSIRARRHGLRIERANGVLPAGTERPCAAG